MSAGGVYGLLPRLQVSPCSGSVTIHEYTKLLNVDQPSLKNDLYSIWLLAERNWIIIKCGSAVVTVWFIYGFLLNEIGLSVEALKYRSHKRSRALFGRLRLRKSPGAEHVSAPDVRNNLSFFLAMKPNCMHSIVQLCSWNLF